MNELKKVLNVNIAGAEPLITPAALIKLIPAPESVIHHVLLSRKAIEQILDGKDDRIFMVVGPCSIHDPKAALEYAQKLKKLSDKVKDKILIIMRVYFEKPRTTIGWKGLINDPYMDDSFHIEEGLKIARKLLIDINAMGLATATEALDPISPQYLAELITWSAIGARTTESQTHREMASGLSMPVGFKNATNGDILVAVNALKSVAKPHHFLGINEKGLVCKFSTTGNSYGHVVLRGGETGPNFDAKSIAACVALLKKNKLREKIVVDCSHANSSKDYTRQVGVLQDGILQIKQGNKALAGFMIESNLFAGNQALPTDISKLKYGVSVTDACVDFDTTENMIFGASKALSS